MMTRMIGKKKRNGFTLIEVVISGVVLTVLAVGLMPALSLNKKAQGNLKDRMTAISILEREMNLLRIQGAKNLTPGTTIKNINVNQDPFVDLDAQSNVMLTTEIIVSENNPLDKYVKLNIAWTSINYKYANDRSYSLAAFIYQE